MIEESRIHIFTILTTLKSSSLSSTVRNYCATCCGYNDTKNLIRISILNNVFNTKPRSRLCSTPTIGSTNVHSFTTMAINFTSSSFPNTFARSRHLKEVENNTTDTPSQKKTIKQNQSESGRGSKADKHMLKAWPAPGHEERSDEVGQRAKRSCEGRAQRE